MKFLKVILSLIVIITAFVGDYVVFNSKYSNIFMFRAISDSFLHGALGFWSAVIFFTHENHLSAQAYIYNIAFCTFISSLIDIDHFIVARSIYFKDLHNLKQRGIFHCTTFWLLLSMLLLLYSYSQRKLNTYIISFMIIIAFTSHHIRDANRRGLWFYPFGSSPPIDKNLYIFLLAVLPHVIAYFYLMFKEVFVKHVHIDYSLVV